MTKWQTFKYYLKPSNIWCAVLNGIFRVKCYFNPQIMIDHDNFINNIHLAIKNEEDLGATD